MLATVELGQLLAVGRRRRGRPRGRCLRCRSPRGRRQPAARSRLGRHPRRLADRRRAADRRLRRQRGGGAPRALAARGRRALRRRAASSPVRRRRGARRACRCGRGRRSTRSPPRTRSARASSACSTCAIPAEWERLAIPRAQRRALWQLGDWRPSRDCRSAVVCASGGRAAIAASALRARLPQPVLRVDGGVADVLAALAREPVRLAHG